MKNIINISLFLAALSVAVTACKGDEADVTENSTATATVYVEIHDVASTSYAHAMTDTLNFIRVASTGFLVPVSVAEHLAVDYRSNVCAINRDGTFAEASRGFILPRLLVYTEDGADIGRITGEPSGVMNVKRKNALFYTVECNLATATEVLSLAEDLKGREGVKNCEPDMLARIAF